MQQHFIKFMQTVRNKPINTIPKYYNIVKSFYIVIKPGSKMI